MHLLWYQDVTLPRWPDRESAPVAHRAHETDPNFRTSRTDLDATPDLGAAHPSLGSFDGEPRVIFEGGRTVGLNELVQMAARVLTQAQTQEVINSARLMQQQQQQQQQGGPLGSEGAPAPLPVDLIPDEEVRRIHNRRVR